MMNDRMNYDINRESSLPILDKPPTTTTTTTTTTDEVKTCIMQLKK